MNWISVKDRLPDNNTYVLIHCDVDNWFDSDDQRGVKFRVAKFVRGLSVAEREKLPDNHSRKKTIKGSDEHGNNLLPYCWYQFGPGSLFGQDVDYWMPILELST